VLKGKGKKSLLVIASVPRYVFQKEEMKNSIIYDNLPDGEVG
jgi:hypothetical protein